MDIKDAEEKVKQADSFLDTLGKTLWKHKWLLMFLLFSYCVYWAFTQPVEPAKQEAQAMELIDEDSAYSQEDTAYYQEDKKNNADTTEENQ